MRTRIVLMFALVVFSYVSVFAQAGKGAVKTETAGKSGGELTRINGVAADYDVVRTKSPDNAKKGVKIFYPQIKGLSDKTKMTKINNALNKDIGKNYDPEESVDLGYSLLWSSNNILSVEFNGSSYVQYAAHPNNETSYMQFNMKTGDLIRLGDIVNVNDDFVRYFISRAKIIWPEDEEEYIKENYFDKDKIKNELTNDGWFYFSTEGLVFQISTLHVLGTYAQYGLSFSDISKYVKPGPLWEMIKTEFQPSNFQIIRDQCFKASLNGFENVWFVSGKEKAADGATLLKFYLIDGGGNVKYVFPGSYSGDYYIRAVSFNDVNQDGQKDVIVMADLDYDGRGLEVKVFLSYDNKFAADAKLSAYVNGNLGKNKTVAGVLAAAKNYAAFSKAGDTEAAKSGTLTDGRDGKSYKTQTIGGQTWMMENLNYHVDISWCYDNDASYCDKYGRLYDWATAKKACPAGWHLPSRKEWDNLATAVGGKKDDCCEDDYATSWLNAGKKLKAKSGWTRYKDDTDGKGDDDFEFSALPGGMRGYSKGEFKEAGKYGYWWTATYDPSDDFADFRMMSYTNGIMVNNAYSKDDGYSVRCVRDK